MPSSALESSMTRSPRPDALRLDTTGRAGQHPERASMSPSISLLSMPAVSPDAAYIAAAAAANVVTSEIINEYHISFPQDQEHEGASVTAGSLSLINAFLDRLLYNFLSCAHSTSLASLRPAVTDVLRPRLAKEAISGADEELQEYLGGDMEELNTFHGGEEPSGDWDLDLVWKRTRLRCMLYTRLGDMEEEDEEMYLEQGHLNRGNRSSQREGGMVSPAVAIFLTSVLEFVGEHALMIAAQAAYKRHETRARIEETGLQKVIVEEVDMERVALNSTLGRLWRSWRASVRSPRGSLSKIPGMGSRGFRGFSVGSRSSIATSERDLPDDADRVPSVAEVLNTNDPSTIPLPFTDHDVAEIEVPGYSANFAQRQRSAVDERGRPLSMLIRTDINRSAKPSNHLEIVASDAESTPREEQIERTKRPRARSLPAPDTPFFAVPEYPEPEPPFVTPEEELPVTQELRDHNKSLIDMAGNSVAVLGDYAIPKPSSVPTSPFLGSDFNATSHIAHEYEPHPRGSYIDYQSENDPAEGALQFDRADYQIKDSERYSALLKEQALVHEPAKGLHPSHNPEASSQPPVSPLIGHAPPGSGRVSPVGQASIRSGEVSPIELSDDGGEMCIGSVPPEDFAHDHLQQDGVAPEEVVPEAETTHKEITSGELITQEFKAQTSFPTEGLRQRSQKTAIPGYSGRPMQGRHRAKAGPTENDYAKEENREAFVIPDDFTAGNHFPDSSSLSRRPVPPDGGPNRKHRNVPAETAAAAAAAAASQLPLIENGQASDVPEKSTTLLTSPTQLSRKELPPIAPSSAARPHAPTSDLEQRRQPSAASAGLDRAPVPRISGTAAAPRELSATSARTSETGSADALSEKSALPIKNRGRVESAAKDEFRDSVPSTTSNDLNRSAVDDRHSRSSTRNSDHYKNFEQLFSSGETLQYTLTPQNMREIEERGSPVQQKSPASVAAPVGSRGTSVADRSPRLTKPAGTLPAAMNGLTSNPVTASAAEDTAKFVIHAGPTVKRGLQLVAKDARMERTNTSDLKDFFRSTGPDPVDPRAARVVQQPSQQNPKTVKKPPPVAVPLSTSPRLSTVSNGSKSKRKFEPREPTRQGNETSSLAEFFRDGPSGAHRVPDADDATVRPQDTHSIVSTQDSFITGKSIQSSVNSRVGLLDSSRNVGKVSAWEKSRMPPTDEPMAPVKTRRRNLDPYPIDFSDEENEDEVTTPRGGRKEDNEESLLDFLRSEPPPGANTTPPPLDVGGPPKMLQRKPSGPSVRSRFTKSGQKSAAIKRAVSSSNTAPRSGITSPGYHTTAHSGNDPHLRPQPSNGITSVYSNNPQIRPRGASLGANAKGVAAGRTNNVRAARKLARDSRDNTNSVRELADFLRNTSPPPAQAPLPPIPAEKEGGFARIFSRRKRSAPIS